MPAEEFVDPLSNYDVGECGSSLERALAEEPVSAITAQPFVTLPPDTPVGEAIRVLSTLEVACVMIAEQERLVGIFSEWDVLQKVAHRYDELATRPVAEVMTSEPFYVNDTDSVGAALSVVALCGYRHIPVLDAHNRIKGIVSPQRIAAYLDARTES